MCVYRKNTYESLDHEYPFVEEPFSSRHHRSTLPVKIGLEKSWLVKNPLIHYSGHMGHDLKKVKRCKYRWKLEGMSVNLGVGSILDKYQVSVF